MIRTVPETGSTNADLLAQLRAGENLDEGYWLVADRQSSGRGRHGRAWFDGAGNFMGSTVVRLTSADPPAASFALVVGIALYEAVAPLMADPVPLRIKWPNDLTYHGAKLAGILLERQGDALVVGVGVNLGVAPTLPDRKTLALSAFGPAPDRDVFARRLAECVRQETVRWRSYGLAPLIHRWEAFAHERGTRLTVAAPGDSSVDGEFEGLDETGALRLRLADGSTRVMHAGDVFFATPSSIEES